MLFIGTLILVMIAALVFAGFAVSYDLVGVERTHDWLRSQPGRVKRRLVRLLDAVLFASEKAASARRSSSVTPRVVQPRRERAAQSVGVNEALQLLGVVLLVARLAGWFDADGAEELGEGIDLEPSEDDGASALPPNPGDHFVDAHLRDGQVIDGYYRTNADATELNNYSGPNGDLYRRANGRG